MNIKKVLPVAAKVVFRDFRAWIVYALLFASLVHNVNQARTIGAYEYERGQLIERVDQLYIEAYTSNQKILRIKTFVDRLVKEYRILHDHHKQCKSKKRG